MARCGLSRCVVSPFFKGGIHASVLQIGPSSRIVAVY